MSLDHEQPRSHGRCGARHVEGRRWRAHCGAAAVGRGAPRGAVGDVAAVDVGPHEHERPEDRAHGAEAAGAVAAPALVVCHPIERAAEQCRLRRLRPRPPLEEREHAAARVALPRHGPRAEFSSSTSPNPPAAAAVHDPADGGTFFPTSPSPSVTPMAGLPSGEQRTPLLELILGRNNLACF